MSSKNGDGGETTLLYGGAVVKHDNIIVTLGSLDELSASLGVVKSKCGDEPERDDITAVQQTLMEVMSFVAAKACDSNTFASQTTWLESKIKAIESVAPKQGGFVMYGGCELSALYDSARAVVRRAETNMSKLFHENSNYSEAFAFINRLSDYLYMQARLADFEKKIVETVMTAVSRTEQHNTNKLDLKTAKEMIETAERKAAEQGISIVAAVCDGGGNPVAVHVMDGALLISYEAALAKAYTAASLKMPTEEIYTLVQPGREFYGLDALGGGKITTIGGGVPLLHADGSLLGGIGISGSTAAQDAAIARNVVDLTWNGGDVD